MKVEKRFTTGVDNGVSGLLSEEEMGVFAPYEAFPCFQIRELFYTEDNPQSLATRHLAKAYDIDLPKGVTPTMKRNFTVITITGRGKAEEEETTGAPEATAEVEATAQKAEGEGEKKD